MKLILFPLVILFVFTLLCQADLLKPVNWGSGYLAGTSAGDGWWDSSGHKVCDENGTAVGEAGAKQYMYSGLTYATYHTEYAWVNTSVVSTSGLLMWGGTLYPIYDTDAAGMSSASTQYNVMSGVGFIGIVAVVTALAVISSVTIFGSGLQGFSVGAIFKGTAFTTLWAVLTAGSWSIWNNVGVPLLVFFYLLLTFMYAVGVINSVGHPMGGG